MKTLLISIVLFLILGCAGVPLTLEEQFARKDALIIETEEFWINYDNCLAGGGTVIFNSIRKLMSNPLNNRRRPKVDVWSMRNAACSPR